jgi:hypothetical protein
MGAITLSETEPRYRARLSVSQWSVVLGLMNSIKIKLIASTL